LGWGSNRMLHAAAGRRKRHRLAGNRSRFCEKGAAKFAKRGSGLAAPGRQ
jgi:hypothetical protein